MTYLQLIGVWFESQTRLTCQSTPGGSQRQPGFVLHLRHGTQARHGPVRRPRRLDGARHRRRSRGRASPCPDVLRARLALRDDARRDRREVRRRRGDGGLRDPAGARGRRRARGSRRRSRSSTACTSSSSRRGSGSSRARSSRTTATRPSPPARPSTSPRGSQQAAEPGQVLLGPGAHRLTLGRVEVEDVGPVELKGLEREIWAWRALSAQGRRGATSMQQAPLVGRDSELELLQNTYDRALRDRRAHLFTIYGEAGVGKSRLAREFSEAIEGATVLSGRSLPYGEGVTYWPLAEMVKCAAGIVDDDPLDVAIEKLRSFCEDEVVADLLGLASGVLEAVQAERSQQEIAWAAREWAQRARAGAAARARLRGHPLGRGAAARADRAPRHLGARGAAARDHAGAARAARHPSRLGRRPRARDLDRARAARPERERGADRRARRRRSIRPSARPCSPRPRATRSSSRRRCGCWPRRAPRASAASRTRCRR